jgi:hypothetical protein
MVKLLRIIKRILIDGESIKENMLGLKTGTTKKEKKKMNELFNRVDQMMTSLVGRENHNHNAQVIR